MPLSRPSCTAISGGLQEIEISNLEINVSSPTQTTLPHREALGVGKPAT